MYQPVHHGGPSLITKVFTGFVAVGVLLIFALAYNLGGTKQAGKTDVFLSESKDRINQMTNQLTMCRDRNQKIERGEMTAQDEIKHQEERLAAVRLVKKSLRREEGILTADYKDCEKRKEEDRELATGTKEKNPRETYEKLLAQYKGFKMTLAQVQKNRNQTRQELIRTIRAYRMDNMELIKEGKASGIDMKASGRITGQYHTYDKSNINRNLDIMPSQKDRIGMQPLPGSSYKWNKNNIHNFIDKMAKEVAQPPTTTAVPTPPPTPPPTTAATTTAATTTAATTTTVAATTTTVAPTTTAAAPVTTTAAPVTTTTAAPTTTTTTTTTTAAPATTTVAATTTGAPTTTTTTTTVAATTTEAPKPPATTTAAPAGGEKRVFTEAP